MTKDMTAGLKPGDVVEVTVDRLGRQGDGVAETAEAQLYIPLTLPGDRLRARVEKRVGGGFRATIVGPVRRQGHPRPADCGHFADCGGCAVQHVPEDLYADWKRGMVEAALRHRGLDGIEVAAVVSVPPGARRRAELKAVRLPGRKGVKFGFMGRNSRRIVDVSHCPVLVPGLTALIGPVRDMLLELLAPRRTAAVHLTWTDSGADMVITLEETPDGEALSLLAGFAEAADIARLTWQGPRSEPELVALRRPPTVSFGGIAVTPPAGGFLQPTVEGEAILARAAAQAASGAGKVADLFCGCGALSLPLAHEAAVEAFDDDQAAVEAINQAVKLVQGVRPFAARCRDLFRNPVRADELAGFGAVLLDPPRAGAIAQVKELAGSGVPVVVMASCNPGTFARDARVLVDGGYNCRLVTPVDQFIWSPHIELVATFHRL